ncbi:MAG: 2-C-methyl-D-erythritol 4-phosphate cytidylyltransferase [Pseudomonadales bacterium]|nr:2-C-methyl-D-erythritol 4-phosphate cytidylyltransferase [Pseudomonadales bacterium]
MDKSISQPAALVAVVPAAGVGRRMASVTPKQYLPLAGKTVIEHAIQPLCDHPDIKRVSVSISKKDSYWADLPMADHPKIQLVVGGEERCHSVLSALEYLCEGNNLDALVLVHDAARPCLTKSDLNRLIQVGRESASGALLGIQVRDTIKRVKAGSTVISDTVDRSNLWHAQTPQMFPLGLLTSAMQEAIELKKLVTDEASAMELAGYHPLMVESSEKNIKITRPEDLELAAYYLSNAERI